MTIPIKISINNITLEAELFDTECAKEIASKLPLEVRPNVWGDEFYFEIPVKKGLDSSATSDINIGDIGYWPPGSALAIFFGRTPMSTDDKPVPASEVNLVGKIIGDATILIQFKGADKLRIEKS
jgi:hypothetical protein